MQAVVTSITSEKYGSLMLQLRKVKKIRNKATRSEKLIELLRETENSTGDSRLRQLVLAEIIKTNNEIRGVKI